MKKKTPALTYAKFFLVHFAFFAIIACGYTTRSSIYPAGTSIFIEPFLNKIDITDERSEYNRLVTYFPILETKVRNAVVDRFLLDGNLEVARSENADFILEGEVVRYARDALQYTDSNEDVTQYRITIFSNLILRQRQDEAIVFKETNFAGDTTYYTEGPLMKTETQAVDAAISDLARRIVERVVESW